MPTKPRARKAREWKVWVMERPDGSIDQHQTFSSRGSALAQGQWYDEEGRSNKPVRATLRLTKPRKKK